MEDHGRDTGCNAHGYYDCLICSGKFDSAKQSYPNLYSQDTCTLLVKGQDLSGYFGGKPSNPKDMIAGDKLPLHLWPETATIMGCLGMLDGALKYGRSNFRHAGVKLSVYIDACKRHLNKRFEGELIDPDSGLPHMAHAIACLAIIIDAEAAGKLTDDSQYPGGYVELINELTPHVRRLREKYADREVKHFDQRSK